MSYETKELDSLVEEWLSLDTNEVTRQQIIRLKAQSDYAILNNLLSSRLQFGTAGLRAKMEAGFNRLNEVTIMQALQGLARYVIESRKSESSKNGKPIVVIGHDHRHNSKDFAAVAAKGFLYAGFSVKYLENNCESDNDSGLSATPLVPFAVNKYCADTGIMITASHNPAEDNGYKVYWNNGCQIIPPIDSGIAQSILDNTQPWIAYKNTELESVDLQFVKKEVVAEYIEKIKQKLCFTESIENVKFIYTPMHGVGYEFVESLLRKMYPSENQVKMSVVKEQVRPDPDFPTVKFPNPEEPGALDLAIELAESDENGYNLILANDPDADRFTAAVKDENSQKFRQLSGNEIGYLFAMYVVEKEQAKAVNSDKIVTVLNSTVSSQMIASMAQHLGAGYIDTLTGFKWIGNKAVAINTSSKGESKIELEDGKHVAKYGFEEAIGYMFCDISYDKDGISALMVFLQMYYDWCIVGGVSMLKKLQEGFKKFGYFKQFNGYYKLMEGVSMGITIEIFTKVRAKYNLEQENFSGCHLGESFNIVYWRDLTTGYQSNIPSHVPSLPTDSSSQMVTCVVVPTELCTDSNDKKSFNEYKEFVRFTARGSGTEPKLKVYVEAKAEDEERSLSLAKNVWDVLKAEWFGDYVGKTVTEVTLS